LRLDRSVGIRALLIGLLVCGLVLASAAVPSATAGLIGGLPSPVAETVAPRRA